MTELSANTQGYSIWRKGHLEATNFSDDPLPVVSPILWILLYPNWHEKSNPFWSGGQMSLPWHFPIITGLFNYFVRF